MAETKEGSKIKYEEALELRSHHSNQRDVLNFEDEYDIHSGDTYTVQHAVNIFGFGWFHVKLSLLVGLCWMADSMEMTILSIVGPTLQCEWNITIYQKAFTTTIVFLGMMLGSTFWAQLSDRYGRKPALTLCGGLLVLYSLLSSMAPNFAWMILLRGLVGFSIGCIPQSVTLYAEFLPSKHKGKCVVLMDCFWALGACFEIALALAIFPSLGWRWLLGLSSTPLLMFTLLTPWLTESAHFHTLNGRNDKAVLVLEQIAKDNNRHMLIGRLIPDRDVYSSNSMRALFEPELRRITFLLWFIWMACAFCYYGLVLVSAEITTDFMDLMWVTFSEFPGIFLTTATIKHYGKKRTMVLQFVVFAVCVALLSLNKSTAYNTAVMFLARGLISGLFQAAYIYTPEVYPSNLRSVGVRGCSTLARLGGMVTPFIAQVLIENSEWQTFAVYSVISLLSAIACAVLPNEHIVYPV